MRLRRKRNEFTFMYSEIPKRELRTAEKCETTASVKAEPVGKNEICQYERVL